ncbi:MAG: CRISPR-associated endoribonuclease Cas6 [Dehalococcoidales bacterium]|nr:CRISPR-associated endoribonuclease Cas6 [Dehalococcoidales bacterium]
MLSWLSMRISLELEPANDVLTLPIHYNHLVQAMIYRNLDEALAEWLHNRGYCYGKRRFKLFTFSRLLARARKYDPATKTLEIRGQFALKVSSPDVEFLESLVLHLVKKGEIRLNGTACNLIAAKVEMPVKTTGPVVVRALSPIVAYSTLKDATGRKKTYYYSPWEREFQEKILENLKRKWVALHEEEPPPPMEGAYMKPLKVSKRNEVIAIFKGTVIKGWTGIYELHLPEPYFTLAYDAGLGSKNSQGFGMVEVWESRNEVGGMENTQKRSLSIS